MQTISINELEREYPGFMCQFNTQLNKEIKEGKEYPMEKFNILGVSGEFMGVEGAFFLPTYHFKVRGNKINESILDITVIG